MTDLILRPRDASSEQWARLQVLPVTGPLFAMVTVQKSERNLFRLKADTQTLNSISWSPNVNLQPPLMERFTFFSVFCNQLDGVDLMGVPRSRRCFFFWIHHLQDDDGNETVGHRSNLFALLH